MIKNHSRIITISGELGSGKSTVAKALEQKLGIPMISTGAFQRELARRRNITTLELNIAAETDESIDSDIDAISSEIGRAGQSTIVDSRMAWHFIPTAFKIFLTVDEILAAERVFAEDRSAEHKYNSIEETLNANRARRGREVSRFQAKYNVNIADWRNFDLIINTTSVSIEDIVDTICRHFVASPYVSRKGVYLTSPKVCFPTEKGAFRDIPEFATPDISGVTYPPVELVYVDGVNLIWGSHRDVAEAILLKKSLIVGSVTASGVNDSLPNGLKVDRFLHLLPNMSELYDWEEALQFRFHRYPGWFDAQ